MAVTRDGESAPNRQVAQERELAELTARIEALRTQFERYFMGLDRLPPVKPREQLEKAIRNSSLMNARKTALKFQFQNLQQRMTTYGGYWDRVLRMIEEGTFRRDKGQPPPPPPMAPAVQPPPAASERAPAAEAARPSPPAGQGLSGLFDEWTAARRQTGIDPNGSVTYDQFVARMKVMADKHREQFGCEVEYGVRVKEGKVALVARPVGKG